ncbi:Uncharacterised protein [Halioglobus japonicus]|nr:Uncharacterised protein [Halioglobus japonicus]
MNRLKQSLRLGTLAGALATIILIYLPTQFYGTNQNELSFPLSDALRWLYPTAIGIVAAIAVLGLLLPPLIARVLGTLLAVLFLGAYFQSGILNWNYGRLDGGNVFDWNNIRSWIDLLVWVVIAVGTCIYYRKFEGYFVWLAFVCASVMLLSAYSEQKTIIEEQSALEWDWNRYSLDPESSFLFSPGKNIIVLALDAVQNDIAWDIVKSNPRMESQLEGFTWYRNATSGFRGTAVSVPEILTGLAFENIGTFTEYREKAFRNAASLLPALRSRGFSVDLYPWLTKTSILPDPAIVSNLIASDSSALFSGITLLDYSLFRAAPHILKGYLYRNGRWLLHHRYRRTFLPNKEDRMRMQFAQHNGPLSRDIQFRKEVAEGIQVNREQLTFKYYHLTGAHTRWDIDGMPWMKIDDARVESSFLSRYQGDYDNVVRAYRKKVYYSFESALALLDELKRSGAYDNSIILILGDHGAGEIEQLMSPAHPEDGHDQDFTVFPDDIARGIPLFLYKPAGATGAMTWNDQPVQLGDTGSLILAELDGNLDSELAQVFEKNRRHGRSYRHYDWVKGYQDKLQDFRKYRNTGHSWIAEDWKAVPDTETTESQ